MNERLRIAAEAALKILDDAQTVDLLDAESRAQVEEFRAALAEAAGPREGLHLTIVYRGVMPGPEVTDLARHPRVSALSWSHAIEDRDEARALLKAEGERL